MNINWSPTLKDAIRDVLENVEKDNGILDAYAAATRLQNELPEENVALEDIIAALLHGRGAIQAIEFTPPARGVLEVVMPGSDPRHAIPVADDEEAVVVPG
ncbi:MAG: hypothetical protein AB7F09_17815 [Parvibaculaceae bacterium]